MSKNARCLFSHRIIVGLTIALFTTTTRGDVRRRACCTETLPKRDYQSAVIPQRGTVASYPAQSVGTPGEPNITTKMFRPLTNQLAVGDCVISNLRLQLYSDGQYILSFKVTNAANIAEPAQPTDVKKETELKGEDTGVQRLPVRHHRVVLTARLFAGAAVVPPNNTKQVDGVVIGTLTNAPALVVAGEEVSLRFHDSALSTRQFNEATLVEFELQVDPEYLIHPFEKPVQAERISRRCKCVTGH